MNVLSLFSGVGGMDVGLERAGHNIVGLCEIDERARSVLRRHFTGVPIHDDVSTFDGRQFRGTVDIVAGGSPCQDLSVAGRNAGLAGQRSGLFWHQCRIADECGAEWVIWENVRGALTSNKGADFSAVLWGLTGYSPQVPTNGWQSTGVCVGPRRTAVWRMLDAQNFGVPQRRRRVFVVAGPRDKCGIEILVEPPSGDGHSETGNQQREEVTAVAGSGTTGDGRTPHGNQLELGFQNVPFVKSRRAHDPDDYETWESGVPAPTMNEFDASAARATVAVVGFNWQNGGGYKNSNDGLAITEEGTGPLSCSQVPAVAIDPVLFTAQRVGQPPRVYEDASPTLLSRMGTGGNQMPLVAQAVPIQDGRGLEKRQNGFGVGEDGDPMYTLDTTGGQSVAADLEVRRLTPRECERLMGWDDDWTRWNDSGEEIPNTHRYKMIGNGVVPQITEWFGRRMIDNQLEEK